MPCVVMIHLPNQSIVSVLITQVHGRKKLIDAPPTLLDTIIHKKHLSHFMAKTMNELAHKSPLICHSKLLHKLFIIILRDIIVLENFLLSFSQS